MFSKRHQNCEVAICNLHGQSIIRYCKQYRMYYPNKSLSLTFFSIFSFSFFKLFGTHFQICLTSFAVFSFFSIENNYYYFSFHISRTQKYNVQNAIVASRTFRDVIMIDGPLTSKPRSFILLGSKFFFSLFLNKRFLCCRTRTLDSLYERKTLKKLSLLRFKFFEIAAEWNV